MTTKWQLSGRPLALLILGVLTFCVALPVPLQASDDTSKWKRDVANYEKKILRSPK